MGTILLHNNMSYRPLPNCVTIKQSPLDGLGLFANKGIKEHTDLGVTHVKFQGKPIIRTPLGGFINHSDQPNSVLSITAERGDETHYRLVVCKDIDEGDEITIKYQHFNLFRL